MQVDSMTRKEMHFFTVQCLNQMDKSYHKIDDKCVGFMQLTTNKRQEKRRADTQTGL